MSQLKTCRGSCKTAACQPTTKAPPTTRRTTQKRVTHSPIRKIETETLTAFTREKARNICYPTLYTRGKDENGRFRKECDRLISAKMRPRQQINGVVVFETACKYSCLRRYY